MFNELLSLTNQLSECLQSIQVDLAKAVRAVSAVKDTLKSKRSEKSFGEVWKAFEDLWKYLNLMDIESELGKLRRPRRLPARLEDGVIVSTVGERQQLMEASEYRCNVYYQVLDSFLAEMNSRFSDESTILMKAVQPCTQDPKASLIQMLLNHSVNSMILILLLKVKLKLQKTT